MSRVLAAVLAFSIAGVGHSIAQTTDKTQPAARARPAASPPAVTVPAVHDLTRHNPVADPDVNKPGAPFAGANSFTEGQVKSRLEDRGFSNVSGLAKDANGIWRGKAIKESRTMDVAVDYQGNV